MQVACSYCGNILNRPPSRFKRSPRQFCNFLCYSRGKGVGYISAEGYRVFSVGYSGNRTIVHEHVIAMERHLGRGIKSDEVVHHVDGNRLNNDITNLRVMKRRDHVAHHHPLTWNVETAKTLILEGRTLNEIGKLLGVSDSAIYHALHRRGTGAARIRQTAARSSA